MGHHLYRPGNAYGAGSILPASQAGDARHLGDQLSLCCKRLARQLNATKTQRRPPKHIRPFPGVSPHSVISPPRSRAYQHNRVLHVVMQFYWYRCVHVGGNSPMLEDFTDVARRAKQKKPPHPSPLGCHSYTGTNRRVEQSTETHYGSSYFS